MPLFYFEIYDGVRIPDNEGREFATLRDARDEALKTARAMMREEIGRGTLSLNSSIAIFDHAGRQVALMRFREALEIND